MASISRLIQHASFASLPPRIRVDAVASRRRCLDTSHQPRVPISPWFGFQVPIIFNPTYVRAVLLMVKNREALTDSHPAHLFLSRNLFPQCDRSPQDFFTLGEIKWREAGGVNAAQSISSWIILRRRGITDSSVKTKERKNTIRSPHKKSTQRRSPQNKPRTFKHLCC